MKSGTTNSMESIIRLLHKDSFKIIWSNKMSRVTPKMIVSIHSFNLRMLIVNIKTIKL